MEQGNQYSKFLTPNEKIIKVIEYAKAELLWNLFWGFLPILVAALISGFDIMAIVIGLLLGLYFIFIGLYRKFTLKYIVTDKRVVLKKGLIGQSTISADYSRVTDVTVEQGILGRLVLHTGSILLNTAGTDLEEITLKWVQDPFSAKNLIYEQLHK